MNNPYAINNSYIEMSKLHDQEKARADKAEARAEKAEAELNEIMGSLAVVKMLLEKARRSEG